MASGIAHDVNNALSPVVAYSELLLNMAADLPESGRNYLRIIRQSGEDISHIVARMRELYRRRSDTEQLVKVNINQVMEEGMELTPPPSRALGPRDGIRIRTKR